MSATVSIQVTIDGSTYTGIMVGDPHDVEFAHNVGQGVELTLLHHDST